MQICSTWSSKRQLSDECDAEVLLIEKLKNAITFDCSKVMAY
ncbi:hypothetical protein FHS15_000217 [Paenibacillus castaneae]|nr:hypothetical protein [Paenibacillus castaneae]NIK75119.1 hypothetical protein [Paenibacillus castaneae]